MPADGELGTDSSLERLGKDVRRVDAAAGCAHVEVSFPAERARCRSVSSDGAGS